MDRPNTSTARDDETAAMLVDGYSRLATQLADLFFHHARKFAEAQAKAARQGSAAFADALAKRDGRNPVDDWTDYATDAWQRGVLFLDTLRERGNIYLDHVAACQPPVLSFDYKVVVDGMSLPRPVNYSLVRIIPPENQPTREDGRPYVIIDPRAGHGSGIGGFKSDSQVGVALRDGHPVYFVIFRPEPVPGQTLGDVCDAEAEFLRVIARRHPGSPKPVVIGNCQGGWATMLLAASNPDIAGPVVLNGAPLSYWAGENGKNPMRYMGGLFGGAVPAMVSSDLGGGKFDGANLVLNFESMNPANTWWRKYYGLYADIDTEAPRFLEFERWWSGFYFMNEEEIRWIVRNLFVGNRLGRGEANLDGRDIDLRAITSPIIVFASSGDNITPPQQALNWIADCYRDETEIKLRGQRILYMLHDDIGHLGIFVSSKVARKEHSEIVSTLKTIEALAPGLYEMIIEDKIVDGDDVQYRVGFAERRIADILKLDDGREDEAAFAPVARLSEFAEEVYELFARPLVRATVTPATAKAAVDLHPLRLRRSGLSDRNPAMAAVKPLAEAARRDRKAVGDDNPFVLLERQWAAAIEHNWNTFRDLRDATYEMAFHGVYGTPLMRAMGAAGLRARESRTSADIRQSPEVRAVLGRIEQDGYPAAVIRMLVMLAQARGEVRRQKLERSRRVLHSAMPFAAMSPESRDAMIKAQTMIAQLEPGPALATLPKLLASRGERLKAMALLLDIAGPLDDMNAPTMAMLGEFERVLDIARDDYASEAGTTPLLAAIAGSLDDNRPATDPDRWANLPPSPGEAMTAAIGEDDAPAGDPDTATDEFSDDGVEPVRPVLFEVPPADADDLLLIKGIGPKLNETLRRLGIHSFRQIANWTPGEIAWVNGQLAFSGRVQREGWVDQARALLADVERRGAAE